MSKPEVERTVDTARAQAFAERMLGNINSASLVLMTSIGHRTGYSTRSFTSSFDQRRDRVGCGPRRALRARMAGRYGHRRGNPL